MAAAPLGLLALPDEVLLRVVDCFTSPAGESDLQTLARLSAASRDTLRLARHPFVWTNVCRGLKGRRRARSFEAAANLHFVRHRPQPRFEWRWLDTTYTFFVYTALLPSYSTADWPQWVRRLRGMVVLLMRCHNRIVFERAYLGVRLHPLRARALLHNRLTAQQIHAVRHMLVILHAMYNQARQLWYEPVDFARGQVLELILRPGSLDFTSPVPRA